MSQLIAANEALIGILNSPVENRSLPNGFFVTYSAITKIVNKPSVKNIIPINILIILPIVHCGGMDTFSILSK